MQRLLLQPIVLTLSILILTLTTSTAEPAVPEHGLFKPAFLMLHGSWSAGTGFLVRVAGRKEPLLVTCFHLFGPAGGLEKQMSPDEVQQQVHGAVGLSVQDKQTIVGAPEFLKVVDVHPMDRSGTPLKSRPRLPAAAAHGKHPKHWQEKPGGLGHTVGQRVDPQK